jgi:hypothetical protein
MYRRRPALRTFLILAAALNGATAWAQTIISSLYEGIPIVGNISLTANTSAIFRSSLLGTPTTFSGASATFDSGSTLYWEQSATLTGKALTFGSGAAIIINDASSSLTLSSNTTATGEIRIYGSGAAGQAFTNRGTISHTGGNGSIYANSFTNEGTITATNGTLSLGYDKTSLTNSGTITADGSATTVYLQGNLSNSGQLRAQNAGGLYFSDVNAGASLGNVTIATGGVARLTGNIVTTALAAPAGGSFELYGGTIQGATIGASAVTFTTAGGTLDGATLNDNIVLADSTQVRLTNNTTFNGATAALGSSSTLEWNQTGTLTGKAITFGSGASVYVSGTNHTLTLAASTTGAGELNFRASSEPGVSFVNQGSLTHTSGYGQIYAPVFTNSGSILATGGSLDLGYPSYGYESPNYISTNLGGGTITADAGSINIQGNFTNQGLLTAQNGGTLVLDGSNEQGYYGNVAVNYNPINASGGTITVNGTSSRVYLRGNFSNNGQLNAQNSGILVFEGTNTTGSLGNVTLSSGGHAYLEGTLANATLSAPTGGSFELHGGTISGGTIGSGALTFTDYGGNVSGATLNDNLVVPAGTYVQLTNNTTFTGRSASLGTQASVSWEQSGTLSSKALTFASGSSFVLSGYDSALTLDSKSSATGEINLVAYGRAGAFTNLGSMTHTSGSGQIYAPTFTNSGSILASGGTLQLGYPDYGYESPLYVSTNTAGGNITADAATIYLQGNFSNEGQVTARNAGVVMLESSSVTNAYGNLTMTSNAANASTGTITATGMNSTVYLRGNFSNSGQLAAADSGALVFDGTNVTGNLGNVTISSGGHAYLSGNLTNTAATLAAPSGGSFELSGGNITGGSAGNGALSFTDHGGTLSGVAISGNLALPAGSHVTLNEGTTFSGSAASLGGNASLTWDQSGTLSGKAITMGESASWSVVGVNHTLTLDSASSVSGAVRLYSDLSPNTTITNQGMVTHNAGYGALYAANFTNSGNITATSGSLTLGTAEAGTSFANTAGAAITVAGAGATVHLQAPAETAIVNQGTIDVQSGTLATGGVLTNAAGGQITGAGTISGGLTMAGGTLAPGTGIATLTLQNSSLGITGASVFAFEINGATSDQLVFTDPVGAIALGDGLVALSVTLLGAPTPATTYNFLQDTSGRSGITGTFAGLASSGDTFTASYKGTSYSFSINYQPNLISVSSLAVPEPSTYGLIAMGLLAVGWQMRRRRL